MSSCTDSYTVAEYMVDLQQQLVETSVALINGRQQLDGSKEILTSALLDGI